MKVLVPTEGSEFSKAAVKKCCKMFDESENTEIEILSVVEPVNRPTDPFGAPSEYIHDLNAAALKKATDVHRSFISMKGLTWSRRGLGDVCGRPRSMDLDKTMQKPQLPTAM